MIGVIYSNPHYGKLDYEKAAFHFLESVMNGFMESQNDLLDLLSGSVYVPWNNSLYHPYLSSNDFLKVEMDEKVKLLLLISKFRKSSSNTTKSFLVHGIAMEIVKHLCQLYMAQVVDLGLKSFEPKFLILE